MKKWSALVCLIFVFSVYAQENNSGWLNKSKSFFKNLSEKIFGSEEKHVVNDTLPTIPKLVKKDTDVENYAKLKKEVTEFDQLSPERKRQFNYKFIQELFQVTRKAEAKDEDLSNWLNVLDQGGSREGIYQALVLDEVYAALENVEENPSEKLLEFSLSFSQKFLNQTFSKDSLIKLNLYSIKRILTEKGLDIIESYETSDLKDLYQWYAVFSSELAKNYGPFLKNEVRQDESVEYHLEWAKSMPIQHIKSEFIIKLHSVMNGLQLLE